jgi:dihydroceramidase
MIYTTCLMIYAGLSYSQSTSFRIVLATLLISLSVFITVYYHYLQDPTFHQNAYALLTAFIVFRSMFIMEYTLRPSLRKTEEKHMLETQKPSPKSPAEDKKRKDMQRRENYRDTEILRRMWIFVAFGLSVFLGGFSIWALDIVYCGTLRKWRRSVGLPWGIVLEGHGWWQVKYPEIYTKRADWLTRHLMTGLGAYCYIVWGIWLRHCLNGRQDEYQLVWPRLFSLPEVVLVKPQSVGNGAVPNGRSKKVA